MTREERLKVVDATIKRCTDIMNSKGVEYSRGEEDVNSNFKRVAEAIGSDPLVICYVYMAKHWDSLASYIKTREGGSEGIESRLDDMHNYLWIFESLIKEAENVAK